MPISTFFIKSAQDFAPAPALVREGFVINQQQFASQADAVIIMIRVQGFLSPRSMRARVRPDRIVPFLIIVVARSALFVIADSFFVSIA